MRVERLKNIPLALLGIFSPFGATVIRPWPGSKVTFEDIDKGPDSIQTASGGNSEFTVPTGSRAKLRIERVGQSIELKVDDFRERPGHTAGALVAGKHMRFKLSKTNPELVIPRIARVTYKGQ